MTGTPKQTLEKFSRTATLRPGLSEEEVARFQTQLPGALPGEIRELLLYSAGFDVESGQLLKSSRVGDTARVLFTGSRGVELPILPYVVALLGDGCGNFWVVDVSPRGEWGAILFVCHDPPVIAIQAPDLASFLSQVLNLGGSNTESTLAYVSHASAAQIWCDDPWLVSVRDARLVPDIVVSKFAEQLPENFCIADLRSKEVGRGFSWGKAGPNTDIRRNGADLLFAVEQKAPSFLKRVLARIR